MKLKIFISFSFFIFLSKSILPQNQLSNTHNITWVVLGDSLTEYNFRAKYHYFDYVAKELSLNIINLGVSSTGYKEDGSDEAFYKRMEKSIKNWFWYFYYFWFIQRFRKRIYSWRTNRYNFRYNMRLYKFNYWYF